MELDELKLTAELAAIRLKEGDLERLGAEVDRMLGYFEAMASADVSALEPTTHPFTDANRLRPDAADSVPGAASVESMIDQAGDIEGRLIVIPNVL